MGDSTTNLDLIQQSQAQKEVTANALFDANSPNTIFGRRGSTTAGTTWGYYGGTFKTTPTSRTTVPNGTIALTPSAINYVEADESTGAVTKNTTAFSLTGQIPLYKVTVGSSSITAYEDWRPSSIVAATGTGGFISPTTTKGDLIARSASADVRVGVGTDGQVLEADSTQTTGLKWATPAAVSTPGGADTEVQFNDAGAFGGSPDFTWGGGLLSIVSADVSISSGLIEVSGSGNFHAGVEIGDNVTVASLGFNSPINNERTILWQTGGSPRWAQGVSSTAESGANAGADYIIKNYADGGTLIGTVLTIERATGDITASGDLAAANLSGTNTGDQDLSTYATISYVDAQDAATLSASEAYTDAAVVGAAGTPGGSNQQIQFNNSGAFGGSANLTWDGGTVAVNGTLTAQGFVNARGTQGPSTFGSTTPLVNVGGSVGPFAVELHANATANGTYHNRAISTTLAADVQTGITNAGFHTGHWLEAMRNHTAGEDGGGTLAALFGQNMTFGHFDASAITPQTTAVVGLRMLPNAKTGLIGTLAAVDILGSGLLVPNATTVYGLRSEIGASTGWWNLYIDGTAANAFAGKTRLGGTTAPDEALDVTGNSITSGWVQIGSDAVNAQDKVRIGGTYRTSGAVSYALDIQGTVPAGATSLYSGVVSNPTMAASTAFADVHHFDAFAATLGSGATINVQTGFHARDMSTSNFGIGFRGVVAAGANKYNLYLDGTAQNYIEGVIGIGISAAAGGVKVHVAGTAPTSGTNSAVIYNGASFPAGTTNTAFGYQSAPLTAASAFTLNTLYHYNANNVSLGSGSAVTNQYGFTAQDLTSASNFNIGFLSLLTSGTNKYSFYSGGTASSLFAGKVRIGSTTAPTVELDVTGAITASGNILGGNFDTDGTLAANSDSKLATQKATKTYVDAAVAGATAAVPDVRQTVLTGSVGSTGLPNALTTGSGLRPGLTATAKPMALAFAAGYSASGAVDLLTRLTADVSDILGADLPARQTNFIHATRSSSSAVTWGTTLAPPQYGEVYERMRNALCHFEGTNGATTFTDDYGNTAQRVGTDASISTAQFKHGASSLRLNAGAGASCAEVLLDTPITNEGSWTLETYIRFNALPASTANAGILFAGGSTSGVGAQVYLFNNSGTLNTRLYLSSQNSSFNIVSNSPGTKTSWATNTWYHVALTYDFIDGAFYLYIDGVLDNTATTTTMLQYIAKIRAGSSGAITPTNGADCWVDEFRFSQFCRYPHGTTFTPGGPFAVEGDFYSIPEMKMYSVTSASATAGTDPGMTAANRVYVGECITGASTISAATTYGYRGRYVGAWTTTLPGINTKTVFNHNLGIKPDRADMAVEWLMTDGSIGYQVADRIKNGGSYTGAYYVETNPVLTRNSGSFSTLNNSAYWVIQKAGGSAGSNSVECRYRFEAQRGW